MNDFLTTIFDDYTKEYIAFYNKKLATFEEQLEPLKREIQLEHLANKKQNGGKMTTEMSTMLFDKTANRSSGGADTNNNNNNQVQEKSGLGLLGSLETDLSRKKFPSLAILGQMGIKNFKPSIRHKIANTCKNYNICNEPNLDTVTPRVGIYSVPSQLSSRQINSKPSDAAFMTGMSENALIDIREDKSGADT